jgi:hypothetical protein
MWDLNFDDTGADGIMILIQTITWFAAEITITLDFSSPRNYKYTLTKKERISYITLKGYLLGSPFNIFNKNI